MRALIVAGLVALLPAAAVAQTEARAPKCMTPGMIEALAAYALPIAMAETVASCRGQMEDAAWLMQDGEAFIASLVPLAERSEMEATQALLRMTGAPRVTSGDLSRLLLQMSRAQISKIDAKTCDGVSRIMADLSALPPERLIGVAATVFELAGTRAEGTVFELCADAGAE
ncbi:MAG: hypothetical protein WA906_13325 [Pacificimonas sp.]